MHEAPDILLSRLDVERIERLLDSGRYDDYPGVDALLGELDRASVCEPGDVPDGVVTMNSTVRFHAEDTDRAYTFTLVYPDNADAAQGRISILSAAGSALLGLRVGQRIEWPTPAGNTLHLRVDEVVYQPETSGELHR